MHLASRCAAFRLQFLQKIFAGIRKTGMETSSSMYSATSKRTWPGNCLVSNGP